MPQSHDTFVIVGASPFVAPLVGSVALTPDMPALVMDLLTWSLIHLP
jgi:hypothetical protein